MGLVKKKRFFWWYQKKVVSLQRIIWVRRLIYLLPYKTSKENLGLKEINHGFTTYQTTI